jgi:hypothetical protein
MATYSSVVARLMLEARFNDDLSSLYNRAAEHSRAEVLSLGRPPQDSPGTNTDRGKAVVGAALPAALRYSGRYLRSGSHQGAKGDVSSRQRGEEAVACRRRIKIRK